MARIPRHRSQTDAAFVTANPFGVAGATYATGPQSLTNVPAAGTANNTVAAFSGIVMDDYVIDDFIALRASGVLLDTNPMTRTALNVVSSGLLEMLGAQSQSGNGTTTGGLRNWAWRGSYLASPSFLGATDYSKLWYSSGVTPSTALPPATNPFTASALQDMRDIAMTAAYANVGSAEFELGILIGEGKETAAYFIGKYRLLGKMYLKFVERAAREKLRIAQKRKKRYPEEDEGKSAAEFHDWWTNSYLEFRFAIMPLVTEFFNFLDAKLTSNIKRQTARGREVARKTSQTVVTKTICSNSNNPYGTLSWTTQRVEEWQVETRGFVTYDTELSDVLATVRNLGLTKPASVLYDLTRLSFVIDYFINIGNYIESLAFNVGVKAQVAGVVQTIRYVSTTTVTRGGSPLYLKGEILPTQQVVWEKTERIAIDSPPLLPTIDVNLSPTKVVDLFALARGILRSL